MRILRATDENEMIACFLGAELTSDRFGDGIRTCLAASGLSERLLTHPDLSDQRANTARRAVLARTRGYGENRELFEDLPDEVTWTRTLLTPDEAARVHYIDYSYWIELSGGSRLPADAATRIRTGFRAFDVPNDRFEAAADALRRGARFPPLILVGEGYEKLVCLEGHLRLTAHALAGFPTDIECLIGTAPTMTRWAH